MTKHERRAGRANGIAIAFGLAIAGSTAFAQGLDRPTAEVWQVTRTWDAAAEREYGEFVSAIGRAVAEHRCGTLRACLANPAINPLLEPGSRPLRIRADCADVPYILRAYFAYRRGLPFAFARRLRGRGRDRRYMRNVRPEGVYTWMDFATPRRLLQEIGSLVHSGFMRTGPDVENSDFYPVRIDRSAIHPGTVFYDPNGHVLVVYDVRPNGDVLFFDGHPGGSITAVRFSERQVLGSAWQGGGFRNFRPIAWVNGQLVHTPNAQLADYDGASQYDRASYRVAGRPVDYHTWVRSRLTVQTYASH